MVHSDRTVVVLLHTHTHFSSWLSTFFDSVSSSKNSTYSDMSKDNITAYFSNLFTFLKLAFYVYFHVNTDCFLPVFHWDFIR